MRRSSLHALIALAAALLFQSDRDCAPQSSRPMPAFATIQDDPALPRVLLLGDSISVGYTPAVREALAGKANVHRPAANCGPTTKGLENLSQWLGDGHWDVIHFNWGLHDLTRTDDKPLVPLDEYEKNLRELVARLKRTGATLVWCSTTPVPPGRRAPLEPDDVVRYNEVARKIMAENGIAIDDLYAFALPRLGEIQLPSNVHVTPEGSKALAQQVAASIESALERPADEPSSHPVAGKSAATIKPAADMAAEARNRGKGGARSIGDRGMQTDARLQQTLRRFPEADLNKDGTLTVDEAREFLRQRTSALGGRASAPSAERASQPSAPAPASSPSQAAEGFVRVEQRDGVWWLVSPEGEPFISIGLNHVAPEMLLLPGNQEATLQRYGADFATSGGRFNSAGEGARKWMEEVFADMHDWGFNALGMHVPGSIDPALYRSRVYSLPSVHAARIEGLMRNNALETPDVFSEAFAARVESTAKAVCEACADNPLVLGYCYCDLPGWVDAQTAPGFHGGGSPSGPWVEAIRSQGAQTEGKQAWIGLLQKHYGSIAGAAAAYGLTASSWDELAEASDWSHPHDAGAAGRDGDAFMAMIAERWYGLLHDAIRRHDPNHLIFGDKLKYDRIPPLLYPILKQYVDMLLIQDSKETVDEQIERFSALYKAIGKPILSGDSGFGVEGDGRKSHKGFLVSSYRDVGEHYAAYLKGIMGLPFMVGWHYCGYIEGCIGSRLEAQEGFKDPFGKPHEETVELVRAANTQAAEWHRASRANENGAP
ncbi:MAG: SGNH/GDSL hydrolase family protein [Candidatus Sumerlaeota bacterium]|nr:SGNH/GDSL hydrolase family protein [Candidatus Sumerlaeota bacterium]